MKKQIKLLFHTPRFMIGFVILALILGVIFIYPIFDDGDPLGGNIGSADDFDDGYKDEEDDFLG